MFREESVTLKSESFYSSVNGAELWELASAKYGTKRQKEVPRRTNRQKRKNEDPVKIVGNSLWRRNALGIDRRDHTYTDRKKENL